MLQYYSLWMKHYVDNLDSIQKSFELKKELVHPTLKTNDYVPFVDNGLDDVMRAWAKNK